MNSRKLFLLLFYTLILSELFSQDITASKRWPIRIAIADSLLKVGSYYSAIDCYAALSSEKKEDFSLKIKLGDAYFGARDYVNAKENYEFVLKNDAKKYPIVHYTIGRCLMTEGRYKEAIEAFNKFLSSYKEKDKSFYKKRTNLYLSSCNFALKYDDRKHDKAVVKHEKNLNSNYNDFAPGFVNDSVIIFSRVQSDEVLTKKQAEHKDHLSQILTSSKNDGDWSDPVNFSFPFDSEKFHRANGTFSADKKMFVFTQCEEDFYVKCDLYISRLGKNGWSVPLEIKEVNTRKYTSTQPTIGRDKLGQNVLYFISDRPEGYGGMDIWYSIQKDSLFQEPRNAGKNVNSVLNEYSPFFDNKTGVLYFSSEGFPGFGGLDIYKINGSLRKWSEPVNLGSSINTPYDEMYYTLTSDLSRGVLVSNRDNALTPRHKNCCDDIFSFQWFENKDLVVSGKLIFDGDSVLSKVPFLVELLEVDSVTKMSVPVKADSIIENFSFNIKKNQIYQINVSKDGYLPASVTFKIDDTVSLDTYFSNIKISKLNKDVAYTIQNVYYNFDDTKFNEESIDALNDLVTFLERNPRIKIEIGAHTDNKGERNYNLKLSQKRAESVVKFLIENGISKDRLVAMGYGEDKPIAKNTLADGSDNPDGRRDNRRTEFKIIGYID